MKKTLSLLATLLVCANLSGQNKTQNVVLITFDGFRWEELFTGAEQRLISKAFVSDSASVVKKFWAPTPEKRREILLPFFWSTLATQGQLYGNRKYGNLVNVTNKQWFSYPGYSEILCGFADDARINSNDKFNNPNSTVLEFINGKENFNGKVAAFSSWDVFPYIINTERSKVMVNGGIVEAKGAITEKEKWINELMHQVPNPLGEVRLDAFTFHYAFEYLKNKKPRVLYIAFDETDDFAHGGKYDLYLHAAQYTDGFIKRLWDWCQSDPQYAGKTTFIITSDHGRGAEGKEDWRHHGIKMPRADELWFAVIGPDTPALGELKSAGQLYQNQVAKTLASFLGLDYQNQPKPGEVVKSMVGAR